VFTVFAPNDDAFAKLGTDTINDLLADTDTLSDILLYHVIVGQEVESAAAVALAGSMVEMANGDSVTLSVTSGTLFVNDSRVIAIDVVANNGIAHVIDTVLIPPAE
ncbi:MAG: fasciclin domain-containing protein, partial [Halieaceae bacterium]|nr:fasciclin domain-containing protein [Halieaceae bacterium]